MVKKAFPARFSQRVCFDACIEIESELFAIIK